MPKKLETSKILLEDLHVGFGEVEQKRWGVNVVGTAINASNLPVRPDGLTLQELLDKLYQIYGYDLSGLESVEKAEITEAVLKQGIYPYDKDIPYEKGSVFTIDGEAYLVLQPIPVGTVPSVENTKAIFQNINNIYDDSQIYQKGAVVSDIKEFSYVDTNEEGIVNESPKIMLVPSISIAMATVQGESPKASISWESPYNGRYVEYWAPSIVCQKGRIYIGSDYISYVCLENCRGIDPTNKEFVRFWKEARLANQDINTDANVGVGGYLGEEKVFSIPYANINKEYPNIIPANGFVWKKELYPQLFEYLKRNDRFVTKEEYEADYKVRWQKFWYDDVTGEVGTIDLTENSPFMRSQGTRSNIDLGLDDLVKAHNHSYTRANGGSEKHSEGSRNGAELFKAQWVTVKTEDTGGDENRPYAYTRSIGIVARV